MSDIKHQKKALIYCRVSSVKQATSGHGLASQESRCREYANAKGYDVEAVFPDDVSGAGNFMNRPGMVALLSYLDAQADNNYVVIFDDLKRFARDIEFHIKLRRAFQTRCVAIECLNYKFDDSPEGRFIENVLAAQGALEREQNGRQTVQRMRARMMNGYYALQRPLGYEYVAEKGNGKVLKRKEPFASIIQEALEGFASGRFDSQAEVARFLQSQPAFPKDKYGRVTQQRAMSILTHPVYAGYIVHEPWEINWVKGHHDGLISLETFEAIQKKRAGARLAPARMDINLDFPLRGFVECNDCHKPLTACWSKGQYKKYPYYFCFTKGCESERKSIPRDKLEAEFDEVMRSLQPTTKLFALAADMFKVAWQARTDQAEKLLDGTRAELKKVERKIEDLLDRIVDAGSPTVVSAYEERIEKLERERRVLNEKLAKTPAQEDTRNKVFERAMHFLANPWNLWEKGDHMMKKVVLRLAFSERIAYCRKRGLRTPKTTLPFKVLAQFGEQGMEMARPERFELPTTWFEARYSIQLS